MRVLFIAFLVVAIFGMNFGLNIAAFAQQTDQQTYQRAKEIPKPLRKDRLETLLPIIRGIYSNTDTYFRRGNRPGEYIYIEKPKPDAEEVITLQNLDDIASVIDYLESREAASIQYDDGHILPRPSRTAFHQLWPDDINFVVGPGLKGCDDFCRRLLIERHFRSITVLETERLDEGSNPIRAVRYSLDEGSCKRPEGGGDLEEGNDETLNLPEHDTAAALPALGLCFQYEPVEIPDYGAFVFFNLASPYWPDKVERTHTKREIGAINVLAVETQIIHPKAFEDLETEFSLSFIKNIAYEFRAQGLKTKTVFAYESACIRPHLPLDETALNLLLSTHEPSETNKRRIYRKYLFVDESRGICTGLEHEDWPHRLLVKKENDDDRDLVGFEFSDTLIEGLQESIEKYIETKDSIYYSDISSAFREIHKASPTQSQIDMLVPVYENMFDNLALAGMALREIPQLPEGSLAGHVKSLNRIRDKISESSGCESLGCESRYSRIYNQGPSVSIKTTPGYGVPKNPEDHWLWLAASGASIYAAAGPKAIKHVEAAHEMGLGGVVYAMGCMGASSDMLEDYALQTIRSTHGVYPQPLVRHYLSLRHSPKADAYKAQFLKHNRVSDYYNSQIRAILAWDNKSSLCAYKSKLR